MVFTVCQTQDPRDGVHNKLFYLLVSSSIGQIFNGRKTDQCGVIVFGSEGTYTGHACSLHILNLTTETKNIVNTANGGYDNVLEYIPIAQPNAATIAKVDALQASSTSGDRTNLLLHSFQFWKLI